MSPAKPTILLVLLALAGCQSPTRYTGTRPAPAQFDQDQWTAIDTNLPSVRVEINGEYIGNTPLCLHQSEWDQHAEIGLRLVVINPVDPSQRESRFYYSAQRRPRKIYLDVGRTNFFDQFDRKGITLRPMTTFIGPDWVPRPAPSATAPAGQ